jgi:hypothetical protein
MQKGRSEEFYCTFITVSLIFSLVVDDAAVSPEAIMDFGHSTSLFTHAGIRWDLNIF